MAEDEEISPGGSRIFRHEELEAEPELAMGDGELLEAVSDHVERHVGPIDEVLHELVSPLVHPRPPARRTDRAAPVAHAGDLRDERAPDAGLGRVPHEYATWLGVGH